MDVAAGPDRAIARPRPSQADGRAAVRARCFRAIRTRQAQLFQARSGSGAFQGRTTYCDRAAVLAGKTSVCSVTKGHIYDALRLMADKNIRRLSLCPTARFTGFSQNATTRGK